MNAPLAKNVWKVLKKRSNEIRSNEIRIRQELPVLTILIYTTSHNFIVLFPLQVCF